MVAISPYFKRSKHAIDNFVQMYACLLVLFSLQVDLRVARRAVQLATMSADMMTMLTMMMYIRLT